MGPVDDTVAKPLKWHLFRPYHGSRKKQIKEKLNPAGNFAHQAYLYAKANTPQHSGA